MADNPLIELFDSFWKSDAFKHDLDFDAKLAAAADCKFSKFSSDVREAAADSVRELLITRLDYRNTQHGGLTGADLCVHILRAAITSTSHTLDQQRSLVEKIRATTDDILSDTDLVDDIKLDFPGFEKAMRTVGNSFSRTATTSASSSARRRPRILAVRNGLNPNSELAKHIRTFAELRIPSSPLVWETGAEDPGGEGGQETCNILREHLRRRKPVYEFQLESTEKAGVGVNRRTETEADELQLECPFYDLLLTYSRGSVYLEKLLLAEQEAGTGSDLMNMKVLVLSPPGQIGRDLLALADKMNYGHEEPFPARSVGTGTCGESTTILGKKKLVIAYTGNDIEEMEGAQHAVVSAAEVEQLLEQCGKENQRSVEVVYEPDQLAGWASCAESLIESMRAL